MAIRWKPNVTVAAVIEQDDVSGSAYGQNSRA